MDRIQRALATFRNPYSCAQTVWAAFGDSDENNLAAMKDKSGGRAPENMCGALYAAIKLLPPEQREQAAAEFAAKTGSCKCRELKIVFRTPCEDCVRAASEILNARI